MIIVPVLLAARAVWPDAPQLHRHSGVLFASRRRWRFIGRGRSQSGYGAVYRALGARNVTVSSIKWRVESTALDAAAARHGIAVAIEPTAGEAMASAGEKANAKINTHRPRAKMSRTGRCGAGCVVSAALRRPAFSRIRAVKAARDD